MNLVCNNREDFSGLFFVNILYKQVYVCRNISLEKEESIYLAKLTKSIEGTMKKKENSRLQIKKENK